MYSLACFAAKPAINLQSVIFSSVNLRLQKESFHIEALVTEIHSLYSSGNFSSMSTKFLLQRQLGYYILQEFIPTILIVALSWVGFWIDARSVPARVSLGITTVLAITTLMFGIQSSLPRVGHVKAIDVYLLGNFLFVFAALVEFAFICSCTKVFSLSKDEISDEKHFHSSVSPSAHAVFKEQNKTDTGCKETGILQRVFNETKQDELQVRIFVMAFSSRGWPEVESAYVQAKLK